MLAAQFSMVPDVLSALLAEGASAGLAAPDGRTAYDFAARNWIVKQSPVYQKLGAARGRQQEPAR